MKESTKNVSAVQVRTPVDHGTRSEIEKARKGAKETGGSIVVSFGPGCGSSFQVT